MTARLVAGSDARDLERNHLIAKQSHDPANRADEPGTTLTGPVHRFGKRRLENERRQGFGENRGGGAALESYECNCTFPLYRRKALRDPRAQRLLFRETRHSGGRRTLRRSPDALFGIRLPRDHTLGANHQTPRRRIGADGRFAQLMLLQKIADSAVEILQARPPASSREFPRRRFPAADSRGLLRVAASPPC